VITGSFNLTNAAARFYAENVLLMSDDPKAGEAYASQL
jgi:hypothetical protein